MIARLALLLIVTAMPSAAEQASSPPQLPSDAGDWRRTAQTDLEAVHRTIAADHPGAFVKRDSAGFRRWLDRGYVTARGRLGQVDDASSYFYLLQGYVGGFRDEHIKLWPSHVLPLATKSWPGFSTRWVDGKYLVAASSVAALPNGTQLVSCEGIAVAELARRRLDRFEGNLETAAGRFQTAPRLLWDRGNPFAPPVPSRCTFRIDGKLQRIGLHYRSGSQEELSAALEQAQATVSSTPGVRQQHGLWWIGLPPAFMSEKDWQPIYQAVETNLAAIRAAPLVIIDARGTTGGSSGYGNAFVRKLYGDAMVDAHKPHLGDVVWRVSPDNRAFLEDAIRQIKKEPTLVADLPNYQQRVARFDKAAAAGQATIYEDNGPDDRPAPPPANPVRGKVVVLTNYSCVSACLDFMDLMTAMPGVVQAGVSTDADTIFMEANRGPLPSHLMLLDVPHKAWIQRPRGSNSPYVPRPALMYHGDLNDDSAFTRWLLKTIA